MARASHSNKANFWRQHFIDFERSQLTIAQFCHSIGCSVPTFYHWKRKLTETPSQSEFLRVQTADQQSLFIEIKLPGILSIRVPLCAIGSLSEILKQVA
jgi:hypothetical protein